jgi:hypothetical protein
LEDDEHTSRPKTIRIELEIHKVATLVLANHSQMVEEVAAAAWVSHGSCHKILSGDMNKSLVTHYSIPSVLKLDQRDDRI